MTVDLSPARRDWALSALEDIRDRLPGLTLDEQLVYAVALLTADADGTFDLDDVAAAMDDPTALGWAVTLLAWADGPAVSA